MVNSYIPKTLSEALDILNNHDCYILMGGTDLMVAKHRNKGLLPNFDRDVLYISLIDELNFIRTDEEGLHIGATTKYIDIINSDKVPQILKDVVVQIASPSLRNMASLVGNIANASPAGDSLPLLYTLDSKVVLKSKSFTRVIPINEFIKGIRKIDRKPEEMITEVIIPNFDLETKWVKVGSRESESISKLSFFGAYKIIDNKLIDFRVSFGSVSIMIIRETNIENRYKNMSLAEFSQHKDEILMSYGNLINPITDQRSTKDYRKKVSINLLENFIDELIKGGR